MQTAPEPEPSSPTHAPARRDAPHLVALDPDHPGFRDAIYRARRDAIARLALEHEPGKPAPPVRYTDAEHATWRTIRAALEPLWRRHLARELHACFDALELPRERVPQLFEVDRALGPERRFDYVPVAGLVEAPAFLCRLAEGAFLSTQYVRHPSRPLYTPEPDVLHEVLGHAAGFAHPRLGDAQLRLGRAAVRAVARGDGWRLRALERVYWWTIEFGLVREGTRVAVVGAGLTSSVGELEQLEDGPELLPLDLDRAAATPYDPTRMQPALFVAESLDALTRSLSDWADRR